MKSNNNQAIMPYPNHVLVPRAIIIASALFFFCAVQGAAAASYDYYVKDGSSGSGTESEPFGSIGDAIDELKDHGGDSIYVGKGSYSEGFTLPKGVDLVGADQGDITLSGLIQMQDGTKLSKVTVSGGGSILALKGADVTIEKVRVRNAIAAGIKAEEGRGTITIRDSVIEGSRKGLYMQAGNELRFEGLEVKDNQEEGLDVREKVSGSIEKSEFRNNGESGLEVVLGDSDLVIRSNTFSGNGASGIAAQFFKGAKDVGNVRVEGNRMSKNDYGIDCKAPQGGSSKLYFLNSLRISDNTFTDNRDGEIAKACKIMTAEEQALFEAEEKKKSEEAAEAKSLTLSSDALADRARKAAAARQEYDDIRESKERESMQTALGQLATLGERLELASDTFAARSKTKCLLFGADHGNEKVLRLALEEMQVLSDRIEKEIDLLDFETNRRTVEEAIKAIRISQAAVRQGLDQRPCGSSLFGWLTSLIESHRTAESLLSQEERALTLFDTTRPREILFLGDMAYHPRLRRDLVKAGDERMLNGLQEEFRRFDLVVGSLAVPLLTDADPIPSGGSSALLSFPTRFANLFGAANIRFMQLGSAPPFARAATESFEKTATNLSQAGVTSFGAPSQVSAEVSPLPNAKLKIFEYREAKIDTTEALREKIRGAKAAGETSVVYLVWDPALGSALSEGRKKAARSLIDAGATLVLGSGLALPSESEDYQSGKIAYSRGFVFDDAPVGLEKESRSLGFILCLSPDGLPTVEEKSLSFGETSGITWKE